jgi:hypothetical protein
MEYKITDDIIIRKEYNELILPYINKQIIKVITGQRRVGKSYILKQIQVEIQSLNPESNIIYINKEDLAFDSIKNYKDLNNYALSKKVENGMNYLIVDEVQEIEGFEKALRSILLDSQFDLYITGSNATILSGELSTLLSGRFIEIEIHSLSYIEFLNFHHLENNSDSLMMYIKYGGLPYLKHLEMKDEIVFGYLKGVYSTIIYRDIIMRHEIRNAPFLENLVIFLADNIGQLFSASKISKYLKSQNIKMATSQIITYLNHLANAYIIKKTDRYDIVGKKIFEVGEKYYFEDIGLRNAINNFKISDLSKITENLIYKHLLFCAYRVKVGYVGQYEIDFVATKAGEVLYVQACYLLESQKTIDREFGNLERIKDNYRKIVVSMDEFKGNTINGIIHMNLREFLHTKL